MKKLHGNYTGLVHANISHMPITCNKQSTWITGEGEGQDTGVSRGWISSNQEHRTINSITYSIIYIYLVSIWTDTMQVFNI